MRMEHFIHVAVLYTSLRRELDIELTSEFGENSTWVAVGNIFLHL